MILAAAVVMATASQAAMFDWSFYDWTEKGDYEGMTAYTLLGSSAKTDWTSATALAEAAISSGTLINDSGFIYTLGQAKSASLVKGTDADVYFAVLDTVNNKYIVTTVGTVDGSLIYGDTEPPTGSSFESLDTDAITGQWHTFQDTPQTPEPTSAMLMLLGVAGLALRRKQK